MALYIRANHYNPWQTQTQEHSEAQGAQCSCQLNLLEGSLLGDVLFERKTKNIQIMAVQEAILTLFWA